MRTKNWPDYVIALVVVACSGVLLAALSYALSGFDMKAKGGRRLEVEFRDATGIKMHSPVRYAGALAGRVVGIRYLTVEERRQAGDSRNAVRVSIRLDEHAPALPSDVVAGLAAETILGEKFIALSAGSLEAEPLPDGAVIQGKDVAGFDTLAQSAQSTLEHVNQIAVKLNEDYPTLIPRLAGLLNQANTLLEEGSDFIRTADGTITNANGIVSQFKSDYVGLLAKIDSLLGQLNVVATNANSTLQQAGGFVSRADGVVQSNEGSLRQIVSELRVVAQNLKVTTTYTKALTAALGERPSRLIWGRKKTILPSEAEILGSTNSVIINSADK